MSWLVFGVVQKYGLWCGLAQVNVYCIVPPPPAPSPSTTRHTFFPQTTHFWMPTAVFLIEKKIVANDNSWSIRIVSCFGFARFKHTIPTRLILLFCNCDKRARGTTSIHLMIQEGSRYHKNSVSRGKQVAELQAWSAKQIENTSKKSAEFMNGFISANPCLMISMLFNFISPY